MDISPSPACKLHQKLHVGIILLLKRSFFWRGCSSTETATVVTHKFHTFLVAVKSSPISILVLPFSQTDVGEDPASLSLPPSTLAVTPPTPPTSLKPRANDATPDQESAGSGRKRRAGGRPLKKPAWEGRGRKASPSTLVSWRIPRNSRRPG